MVSQSHVSSIITHTNQRSKFVFNDHDQLEAGSLMHKLSDSNDPEDETSSSEEIDEEEIINDLMQTANGREFMSFVKSRNSGLLKSQSISADNNKLGQIISPKSSMSATRRSQVDVAPRSNSPVMNRQNYTTHRLSNDFE